MQGGINGIMRSERYDGARPYQFCMSSAAPQSLICMTTADLKLVGTALVTSDTFTVFNIVGPSDGQRFSNSFANRGSRRQVVGFEVKTSLDNVSRETLSKIL